MSVGGGQVPLVGKIADIPNAEEDCLRHSRQWQKYTSRGAGCEARKSIAPHWQRIRIFSVGAVFISDNWWFVEEGRVVVSSRGESLAGEAQKAVVTALSTVNAHF